MKIVYWARMPLAEAAITKLLQAEPDVDLSIVKTFEDLKAALPGADGLVTVDSPMELADDLAALLRAPSTKLRWLHVVTSGREGIIAARVPQNIIVTGPAGAHAPALAEHALAFMLNFTRRMSEFWRATQEHKWDRSLMNAMGSLEARTLAIVGFGYAGREVAKRARPFGMKILAVTRSPKDDPLVDEVHPLASLRDVIARADFVVVTIAQTSETLNLFGAAEFAAFKPGAYFVNVARGGIVDQVALIEALRSGKIAGAGLDVTEPEPLPPDNPLWDAPNLIVSPHFGGGTSPLSQVRLSQRVIENLEKFRKGTLVPT